MQLLVAFGCRGLTRAKRDRPRRRLWLGDFTATPARGLRLLLPDMATRKHITWCWACQTSLHKDQSMKQERPAEVSRVAQSCPTLYDPMDCSLPGSSHGIFQARVLEWVPLPSPAMCRFYQVRAQEWEIPWSRKYAGEQTSPEANVTTLQL